MAYIDLGNDSPGISGLLRYSQQTAQPLLMLAEMLLKSRANDTLTQWERELIATYVSHLNQCNFCYNSHAAVVKNFKQGKEVIDKVIENYQEAPISDRLKALLTIASKVQKEARKVLPTDVELAKQHGASDKEIHDTVLIAAAFCMYNKYVDGLGTEEMESEEHYLIDGKYMAEKGYYTLD